jgi:Ca2+-binding RTX toxin-like protein
MRRSLLPVAIALAAWAVLVPQAPAGTIVANVAGGVLTVTGTAGDDAIAVRCDGGNVKVNQADPSGGAITCSDLVRIRVVAGDGSDRVSLSDVGPSVFGELEDVSLEGGDGEDTLIGSAGVDTLRGGDGRDRLEPGAGPGEILGGHGKDTVSVTGDGNWILSDTLLRFTTQGADNRIRSIERVNLTLGNADSLITASTLTAALTVDAGSGNDLVASGTGNDRLDGGDGNDFLQSGDGNDVLEGGPGDDVLRGDNGNDRMDGGSGNDTCTSGAGADLTVSC